ncbi:hypothetical protein B0A55_00984 [Friedmanniomyces simplex]|uniref:Uncharacterized protein n=1 Tax=Friedmanniomyces simplex TaxID=329884 RepID=A0A4U0Y0L4_9PEZI|nr:hypothetical protein B0A55_00984 [Friedmanniomyces simplex]
MSLTPKNSKIEASQDTPVKQEPHDPTSPMHSPASSPPVSMAADAQKQAAESPSRQRSHEDMNVDSRTSVSNVPVHKPDEPDLHASQIKPSSSEVEKQANEPSSIPAHISMPPPAGKPVSAMAPPSSRPPRSGQGSQKGHVTQTRPIKSQTVPKPLASHLAEEESSEATIPDDASSDGVSTPSEPHDRIADFDWTDLERRYHHRMGELGRTENQIYEDFNQLCDASRQRKQAFFSVWAATSHTHEVDRSYKRLKTQTTLVQHQEDELERKRGHYIKVVEAFKSALQLLGN